MYDFVLTKTASQDWLRALWRKSLAFVQGSSLVFEELSRHKLLPGERWHVVAVGKAASSMAAGAAKVWGTSIASGWVITKEEHGPAPVGWDLWEAGHPVPDERSLKAAERLLALANSLQEDDRLLLLLSGGASSLLAAPVRGLSLSEKASLGRALIDSGATIEEINCVRKHLSRIKGGGLLRCLRPARGMTLGMSDVEGDRPEVIGSGPTVPDSTTFFQALRVMEEYSLARRFPVVVEILREGLEGKRVETLELSADWNKQMPYHCLASNRHLLETIQKQAEAEIEVVIVEESLYQPMERVFGHVIQQINLLQTRRTPILLLMGGEPTLRVPALAGRGGRMQHLALRVAGAIYDCPGINFFAAGSDGTDGPTEVAGAIVDGSTYKKGIQENLDLREQLKSFASYDFHQRAQTALKTGPTGTHLGDVVMILYCP